MPLTLRRGLPWLLALLTCASLLSIASVVQARMSKAERIVQRENRNLIKAYMKASPGERPAIGAQLEARLSAHELRRTLEAWRDQYPKRRAGIHSRSILVDGERVRFTVVAPRRYDRKRRWPLHMALHGGGSYGRDANGKKRYWDEKRCLSSGVWGRRPQRGFILVCPTTHVGKWWKPEGDKIITAVFQKVIREFNVDTNKVSVGGLSNGGTGTWHITMKYPWMWAAAIPRCAGEIHNDDYVRNIESMPVYMIHGTNDHLIPVESSRNMSARLAKLGNEARLTEIEGGGHFFFSRENRQVVPWMLAQKRMAPEEFTYTYLHGNPAGLVYWVHAPGAERVAATMVRDASAVKVTLKGERFPKRTTVFVPDTFAEPGAQIRIFVDGVLQHEGPIRSSVAAVLESFRLTGDLERTYTVAVTLDLPEPPPPEPPETPDAPAEP